MKDNAGNTLLLTCSIVILPRLPHPFPERSSKVSWNFKVIKGISSENDSCIERRKPTYIEQV